MKSNSCGCKNCQCDPCECSHEKPCSTNTDCSSTWCNWKNSMIIFFVLFALIMGVFLFVQANMYPKTKEISNVKQSEEIPQDAMMREHCKMMPNMAGCEKYKNNTTSNNPSSVNKKSLNELILVDDETTTDVKPTEVVNLKDGETYDLTIQKVRKVINGKTFIMLSYNGSIP